MKTRILFCAMVLVSLAQDTRAEVPEALLQAAGDNRHEIELALSKVPPAQRAGLEFLILNMPAHDLSSLSASFLLENTRLAYESRDHVWTAAIPESIFLNAVLPYASINERRDNWRADFRKRFLPLVAQAKTPSQAAAILNQQIFQQLNVKYSTKRMKADQSPYESMESGLASCTGLSILLIDACRSVGVPARLVGTPMWSNNSGNHSWVEIWDDGWHFTGAAEPTGDRLDRGWFIAAASKGMRDDPRHAIFATSFRKTPLNFPCVWDPKIDYLSAVNVTDRYVAFNRKKPEGQIDCLIAVRTKAGKRISADISISRQNEVVFSGKSNDDRFDTNDHLRVSLPKDVKHVVLIKADDITFDQTITPTKDDEIFEFILSKQQQSKVEKVDKAHTDRQFAQGRLSREEVEQARRRLGEARLKEIRAQRKDEMDSRIISLGDLKMPFYYKKFGKKPAKGWSLYLSLHGGGGAPAQVNDQQWENQKRLYQLEEGIYLVPRAPTNTWDLWHQGHIDEFFTRIIENLAAFEGINRDRVYLMGYSAGGDGVYQLAPRMGDRWAAAAMMAGHPNETSPLGLRNVPFALQVGGRDAAYKRNEVARQWEKRLADLQRSDPGGYVHLVKIYPDKGHWMDLQDAIAIGWMAKHTRNPTPKRIVWKQDNVTHSQLYWLAVDDENRMSGSLVVAEVNQQTITITTSDVKRLTIHLDDRFIDLEKPVSVVAEGVVLFQGKVTRTIANLSETFSTSGDPLLAFPASVTVEIPASFPTSLVSPKDIPTYTAQRTKDEIKLDGKLDESAWTLAQKTPAFVDLISGEKTRHETRAAILWDEEHLYIGFWIEEPKVDAKYQQRDDPLYYDNDVEVFIAGQDAYYELEINARGTIYEAFFVWDDAFTSDAYANDPQLRRGAAKSQAFNGVGLKHHPRGSRTAFLGYDFPMLKSAVHIEGTLNNNADTDRGWTVELAFPWKSMGSIIHGDKRSLPPKTGDKWRIDLFRFNKHKAPAPAMDSGGWAWGKHAVWDSHIPEIFPIVTFSDELSR